MHKNNKGFTPLFWIFTMRSHAKRAGFTFIELITAAVILGIVVAGVYASFLSSAKFAGSFRHDVMAVIGAQGIVEKWRAAYSNHNPTSFSYLDPGTADVSGDDMFSRLSTEVQTGLNAGLSVTGSVSNPDVNLGSGYVFRRLTTTVTWNERNI